ncbi:MAG: hypothetical protein ACYTFW_05120 [Planctomycetota bacterium]|jgi:hypothetical protein
MKLTIEEKLIYSRIKRAAIIWLLLLRFDPDPITEVIASEILQIDRSTARGYFKTLAEVGVCTRLGRYKGFILTQSGRQLSLPNELQLLSKGEFPPSPDSIVEDEESLKESQLTLIIEEGGIPPLPTYKDYPEIAQLLLDIGIVENSRTRKLLPHLTPDIIRQVSRKIKDDPYRSLSETGILVVMLEGEIEKQKRTEIDELDKYAKWED